MVDIKQCDSIWTEFLQLWPVERVRTMTLREYHTLNDGSSFERCLESMTEKLGSIWGGSAFKFGIYQRGNMESIGKNAHGYTYGEQYAWRSCLGSTPEEAFAAVKKNIVNIIDAVQSGNLDAVTTEALWPIVAWKIAFLYQDRENPQLVSVYLREKLIKALNDPEASTLSTAELYRRVMSLRGDRNIHAFSKDIWSENFSSEKPQTGTIPESFCPLNQILYGPPGTGKTYAVVDKALEIFASAGLVLEDGSRKGKKECFDRLMQKGHIRFVTFHQSFSYEDFVEGIRAVVDERGNISYTVQEGIFKELCDAARSRIHRCETQSMSLSGRKIWKMSLGNTQGEDAGIYDECLRTNCVLMGYGGSVDFSSCRTTQEIHETFARELPEQLKDNTYPVSVVERFCLKMKPGDIVIISDGNHKFRAIGEITGKYRAVQRESDSYGQCRDVRWLCTFSPSRPADVILRKNFTQLTLYALSDDVLDRPGLENLLKGNVSQDESLPYVLIIDEINRGNIARIFGELITLIEDSRRESLPGSASVRETLSVRLPYSREMFTVPENVYIIGTMNTADRSLTSLDIALRRRFSFVEMPPRADLLEDVILDEASGISLAGVLNAMNQRIGVLLDKEHRLGHAPFMGLVSRFSLPMLARIFRHQILPLLEEYFFEDWQKIQWVLNDHRKLPENRFLRKRENVRDLFGEEVSLGRQVDVWEWNQAAFDRLAAYVQIVSAGIIPEEADPQEHTDEPGYEEAASGTESTGMKLHDHACWGDYRIEQYSCNGNFPIRIKYNNIEVPKGSVTKYLRDISQACGIDLVEGNTQRKGAELIRSLNKMKGKS